VGYTVNYKYGDMAIYILAVSAAAMLQIGTVYFLRANALTFLYAIPFILVYQFLFLWSYSNSPKFITIWFIATALTNGLAFLVGYYLWHEHVSLLNIVGVVLIVVGIVFLNLK
jgi:multidrug transporter EmrE-like cation transporter